MSVVFATAAPRPTDALPVMVSGASGSVAPSSGDVTTASIDVPPGRVAAPPATASKSAAVTSTAAPQSVLFISRPLPFAPGSHGPPQHVRPTWVNRPFGPSNNLL